MRAYFVNKMYNSKPMRENPDEIDYFMLYSEAARIMDGVYAKVLRKMVHAVVILERVRIVNS